MIFNKRHKIWKCCEEDGGLSPIMRDVFFDGKALIATDGRIVVIVPVEDHENDAKAMVSKEAVVRAEKLAGRYPMSELAVVLSETKNNDGVTFPSPNAGEFPNVGNALKDIVPNIANPDLVIGIDATLLKRLSDALGDDKLVLYLSMGGFKDKYYAKGIAVTTTGDRVQSGAMGCIMPIKVT